ELLGELVVFELLQGLPAGLGAVGGFGLLFDGRVDGAALFGDFGEVADAGAGDEDGGSGFLEGGVDAGRPVDAGAPWPCPGSCGSGFSRELLILPGLWRRARG